MVLVFGFETPALPGGNLILENCAVSIDAVNPSEGAGCFLVSPVDPVWESRVALSWYPNYARDWSAALGIRIDVEAEDAAKTFTVKIRAPDYANRLEATFNAPGSEMWFKAELPFATMTAYGTPDLSQVSRFDIWYKRENQMLQFRLDALATIIEPAQLEIHVHDRGVEVATTVSIDGLQHIAPTDNPAILEPGTYEVNAPIYGLQATVTLVSGLNPPVNLYYTPTVLVVFASDPPGAPLNVSGQEVTAPVTLEVVEGSSVAAEAQPWNGYEFIDWKLDGETLTDQPALDTGSLDAPAVFTAHYSALPVVSAMPLMPMIGVAVVAASLLALWLYKRGR